MSQPKHDVIKPTEYKPSSSDRSDARAPLIKAVIGLAGILVAVAFWFMWVLPHPLDWKEALVAARFAAPTSAGILFAMLKASGLKETWLFRKARVLAIFDDVSALVAAGNDEANIKANINRVPILAITDSANKL